MPANITIKATSVEHEAIIGAKHCAAGFFSLGAISQVSLVKQDDRVHAGGMADGNLMIARNVFEAELLQCGAIAEGLKKWHGLKFWNGKDLKILNGWEGN